MKCPQCHTTQTAKNGYRRGRQCYKCKQCDRQFLEFYRPWRYSDDIKQLYVKMYLNGMGLRGIERVSRDVEMFAPFAASLLEVSDSSFASLVHYLFSNARLFKAEIRIVSSTILNIVVAIAA
jgi:hypothetical protein